MSIPRKSKGEDFVFFLPGEKDERIQMEFCGISYCSPDYAVSRTDSPIYVIEYICSGRGVFRTNGLEFRPCAGDVYLAHAGLSHAYRTDPSDPWVKIYFNVAGSLVDMLIHLYGLDDVFFVEDSGLGEVFLDVLAMVRKMPDRAKEAASLAVHRILFGIADVLKKRSVVHSPSRLLAVRGYLDSSIFQKVDSTRMALRFGYSVSQLNRLFRMHFGVSPHQYLLERKLDAAEHMLLYSNKSVKTVAAELCFADEFYFSTFFRRKRGVSPGRFRSGRDDPRH